MKGVNKKLRKVGRGGVVLIEWRDAYTNGTWTNIVEAIGTTDRPAKCVTVGFLVAVGKHQVRVAHSGGPGGNPKRMSRAVSLDVNGMMTIPLGWIADIQVLRKAS